MTTAAAARRQGGFSLLEVLVAFVILVAALSVIYPLVGNGLRAAAAVDGQTDAVRLADSVMARVGRDLPLQAGEREVDAGEGYRWRLRIERYWPWTEKYPEPSDVQAWSIELTVYWPGWNGERSLEVHSLRLAGDAGE